MVTQLREAFADPDTRVGRTVVMIDQVGSTQMKEQQPESAWLPGLGWLYDSVTMTAVDADPDVEVKYLGDGILLSFDSDKATEAVNVAIRVQETINEASGDRAGAKGAVDFTCSIGIGTGSVVMFTTPTGSRDYVGSVIDRARRLCDTASPKALFVDRATASAANIMKIRSRLGEALSRLPEQYQGDVQRAPLKGFAKPVEYYEVLWGQQLYGLKSEAVTRSTERPRSPQVMTPDPPPAPAGLGNRTIDERHSGQITCWKPDAGFGFVRDPLSGEDFYFRRSHMVYPEDTSALLKPGARVAFVASGTGDSQRKRSAMCVLVVGEYADGVLKLPDGKPHGWLRVVDGTGNSHHVFTVRRQVERFAAGATLSFRVSANEKGALAEDIAEVVEEDAA